MPRLRTMNSNLFFMLVCSAHDLLFIFFETAVEAKIDRSIHALGLNTLEHYTTATDASLNRYTWKNAKTILQRIRRIDPDTQHLARTIHYILAHLRASLGHEISNPRTPDASPTWTHTTNSGKEIMMHKIDKKELRKLLHTPRKPKHLIFQHSRINYEELNNSTTWEYMKNLEQHILPMPYDVRWIRSPKIQKPRLVALKKTNEGADVGACP